MTQKILLAEDDNDMRRFLVKALEKAGYKVLSYDNGASAYDRLREEPFSLLLTDIVMPEMDGIELAPLPWLVSRLRAALSGSRARFLRADYETVNFGHYDVVFAYLSPAAMAGLWRKAEKEMRPGSILLSYEFDIPGRMPDHRVVTTNSKKILFLWQF